MMGDIFSRFSHKSYIYYQDFLANGTFSLIQLYIFETKCLYSNSEHLTIILDDFRKNAKNMRGHYRELKVELFYRIPSL